MVLDGQRFKPVAALLPIIDTAWIKRREKLKALLTTGKNKARTGPKSATRFKPEVHSRSKLKMCTEQEQLK